MYLHFEFADGSNPYIATSNRTAIKMLNKYECKQVAPKMFIVKEIRKNKASDFMGWKEFARDLAITWQETWDKFDYDMVELSDWRNFFHTLGARTGLIREFRENGII